MSSIYLFIANSFETNLPMILNEGILHGRSFYFYLHCLDHLSEAAKGIGFAFSAGVSSCERRPMMPVAFGKLCKALPHTY